MNAWEGQRGYDAVEAIANTLYKLTKQKKQNVVEIKTENDIDTLRDKLNEGYRCVMHFDFKQYDGTRYPVVIIEK